jgi:F-type H+-transporting ATPase subunit a
MLQSFEWVTLIPGLRDLPVHLAHTILVVAALSIVVFFVSRKLRDPNLDIVPESSFGLLTFFEVTYEAIMNLSEEMLGHHAPKFLYLIGALGYYILFSNLLGVVPGFAPPTDNINTTAAVALVVFFATHIYGFSAHGISYVKHFAGPSPWLAPLMIPIEIIGHLARPLSLSLRLFGNMFGDHTVLAVFVMLVTGLTQFLLSSNVVFWAFAPFSLLIPTVVIVLGMFVMVVQALVFCLLTMSYLAGAVHEAH